jgi:hypothetical protein
MTDRKEKDQQEEVERRESGEPPDTFASDSALWPKLLCFRTKPLVLGQLVATCGCGRAVETTFGAFRIGKSRDCLEVPAVDFTRRFQTDGARAENAFEISMAIKLE